MRRSRLSILSLVILIAGTSSVSAFDPASPPKEFECRYAEVAPKIDGSLDEVAWQNAMVVDRFALPWLKPQTRSSRTATKARLLWDRDYLYFSAEMEDHDLFADITEHDGMTWFNDVFELFFKPAVDRDGYYEFQVNAAGTRMDMFVPKREPGSFEKHSKDGTFRFDAEVRRNGTLNERTDRDKGWSVEGRIAWTDFLRTGGRPAVGEVWKFSLCRYDYSVDEKTPELSTMAPLQTANFHQHEDYADLKFIRGVGEGDSSPGFNPMRPLPRLTTSRVIGSPEPPLPYKTAKRFPNLKVNFPIAVVHQPGSDRVWCISQARSLSTTVIERFVDRQDVSETEILLPVDDRVAYDIAFHPQFERNGFVYVGYNKPRELSKDDAAKTSGKSSSEEGGQQIAKKEKYSAVSRFKMNPAPPYEFDPKSEVVIIEWPSDGHNGAAITFGMDGMLYVTTGDGTSDSDTNLRGQDMTKLTAKVLRIDVDRPQNAPGGGLRQYSVPSDNPFVGRDDVVPETWAFGLRNPWRMTTDRKTGHIWVGNNGQDLWEQVYFVRKGDNYGWSVYEGSHPFYLSRQLGPAAHTKPTLEHHHSEARSLTGGIVCYGGQLPELNGVYVYGDHSTGRIWGARHDGEKVTWHQELADTPFHITGFGTDSKGDLLICDHGAAGEGGFYTLVRNESETGKGDAASSFPRKLSESGLFRNVRRHEMSAGIVPYSVNAPLWSDGTDKARYFGIPGELPRIDFNIGRTWGLPENTVLIKSFAIEMTEGDPSSRRWIETRFLTRQQNEWLGYSYVWNDDQSDGTLVAKEGLDREFTITTTGGSRIEKWHYPSRTECMVCHSRAAGFVLGLSTLQMNKAHDYGNGHVENQLSVLERLGLFDIDPTSDAKNQFKEDMKKAGLSDEEISKRLAELSKYPGQRSPRRSSMLGLSPEKYEHLVDPYLASEPLESRARSYLHANCAICHVEAGGGNAQMQLEWKTPREKMKLINEPPVHDRFNIMDAKLVAPGHPEKSILLQRVGTRGRGQMPKLGTSRVDDRAVALLREWILSLSNSTESK